MALASTPVTRTNTYAKIITKVGILTAGGLAPCLASAVGGLIQRYSEVAPHIHIICYKNGYRGLLKGDSLTVTPEIRANAHILHEYGGSPIGNSRVKLTNVKDCVAQGLVKEGENPLQRATDQLIADGVDILHTIGGDDTNTAAADLAAFMKKGGYDLGVIGLPKTIDNDVVPIKQTLGAYTAAEQGARFFRNVVAENTANPRMLIIHEVMGRACGWLTAETARRYRKWLEARQFVLDINHRKEMWDIHAVYVPEMAINLKEEAKRLRSILDTTDNVNIFLSEGAGVDDVVRDLEARGEPVPRDAFGHVKLDLINPGQWFAKNLSKMIGADKVLVQKSGYFARSAPASAEDLHLIKGMVDMAVESGLRGKSGVIGHDIEQNGRLRAIEFRRIKGHRHFDIDDSAFTALLKTIGQPKGEKLFK